MFRPHGLLQAWRESLQFRTVVTTVLVTVLVVGAAGVVLVQRISDGLLAAEQRKALAEAAAGRSIARTYADPGADTAPELLIDDLVADLAERGGKPGYDIVLVPKARSRPFGATELVSEESIPDYLVQAVQDSNGNAWVYADIRYNDDRAEPGLIVGAPVNIKGVGQYRLYYLFQLKEVEETIALVRSTVLLVGVALVVLLGLMAWLLTHRLVKPVRQAARTASALATGDLSRRLEVRGEDEMARLASSFNSMADSLESQILQLRRLSEMQRRFVGDVSHELRTPLTTIRMAAEVLAESSTIAEPQSQRTAELLQSEVERFESLLGDLLEVSRIDSGQAVVEIEDIDLVELVSGQIQSLQAVALENQVELGLRGLPELYVGCDSRRIKRIIRNLLVNAIEYGAGFPVQVSVASASGTAQIRVIDHGSGLKAADAEHVFERFWRADPARVRTLGGNGLGLSISREDARLHGGELAVSSALGKGCVFTLSLPLQAPEPVELLDMAQSTAP